MGIIERIGKVLLGGLTVTVAGVLLWRYLGPPILLIEPDWWNINYPIPRVQRVARNYAMYEQINMEKNVGGTWTPITPTPLRANVWGFMEYITPPSPSTGLQLGTIEYRAVGLESGKMSYHNVTVSNEFR
jgi:hypothetical protein